MNAKGVDINSIGGSTGSLTPADVAASLSGANKQGVATLLVSIGGGDRIGINDFNLILNGIKKCPDVGNWKHKQAKLITILRMALIEHCHHTACPTCKGLRHKPKEPETPCRRCRATGVWTSSHEERAKKINVSQQAWSQTWELRFNQVQSYIQQQEYEAMKMIYKKLNKSD